MENKKINLYNIRYNDSMQPIDWAYYTKFYPEKAKAIKVLRMDTGISLKDGKDAVEEIFARLERGEVQQRPANAEAPYKESEVYSGEGLKNAGKGAGCCLFSIFYIIIGVIFSLAGINIGKKRK